MSKPTLVPSEPPEPCEWPGCEEEQQRSKWEKRNTRVKVLGRTLCLIHATDAEVRQALALERIAQSLGAWGEHREGIVGAIHSLAKSADRIADSMKELQDSADDIAKDTKGIERSLSMPK